MNGLIVILEVMWVDKGTHKGSAQLHTGQWPLLMKCGTLLNSEPVDDENNANTYSMEGPFLRCLCKETFAT